MDHADKVEHYLEEMDARGVARATAAPPAFQTWWARGKEIPPPLFLEFGRLAGLAGWYWGSRMFLLFAVPTAILGLIVSTPETTLLLVAFNLGMWAVGGLLFGVILAAAYRRKAVALDLPAWEDYPPTTVNP